MITAGIDVGAETTKIVLIDGRKVLSEVFIKGEEAEKSAIQGLAELGPSERPMECRSITPSSASNSATFVKNAS